MPLTLLPTILSTEIPTIARVHLAAFLTGRIYRVIWPQGATPAVIESQESRHLKALTSDPTVRYAKVVEDDEQHQQDNKSVIIAFAKWHVFATPTAVETRQDSANRTWPPDCNKECVEEFWAKIQAIRNEWGPKLGPHMMLDVLATDPAHMRKGAGKLLVRFGTDLADELGLPCFLEGSPEGEGLYRSCGFEPVGVIWMDLDKYRDQSGGQVEGGGGRGADVDGLERSEGVGPGWYKHVVMVRPVKSR